MGFTIRDIARLAGVSHATVSRVINNSASVHPDTYKHVMQIIQKYGYSPQISARSLNSGKHYALGLMIMYDVFSPTNPVDFIPGILKGISNILINTEYTLCLYWDVPKSPEQQLVQDQKIDQNLDGLFILGLEANEQLAFRMAKFHIPVVLVNQQFENLPIHSVVTDDYGGASDAVKHLLAQGHREIVFIEGDPAHSTSVLRKRGFLDTMRAAGVPADPELMLKGNYSQSEAHEQTVRLLSSGKHFTAVFASNDIMALGVIRAMTEHGLEIPRDVSVIGFDDTEFAALINPPLTTVRKPRVRLGYESAKIMLQVLGKEKADDTHRILLPTELVVRSSTREL